MSNTEQLDPAVVALLLVAADNDENLRASFREAVVGLRIARESQRALACLTDSELREGRSYRESKGW